MGVIYKIKPEIKNYILEQKKANPNLSCRGLIPLLENKFQIKVSKSSINSFFKEAGLSLPIGRRRKKRRREVLVKPLESPQERQFESPVETLPEAMPSEQVEVPIEVKAETPIQTPAEKPTAEPISPTPEIKTEVWLGNQCSGAILLKAADSLIGGNYYFTEAIKKRLNWQENDLFATTESLIYLPLFTTSGGRPVDDLSRLWSLIGKKLVRGDIQSYLLALQGVKGLDLDIFHLISNIPQEVRAMEITLSDGNILYLDGQLHTIWSTPYIPYDFATPPYNMKLYINKYFSENSPFILFMAPGYEAPTKEFFHFILNLDSAKKGISRLTLYNNKLERLDNIELKNVQRQFFIFALWPWQFVQSRQVKKIGDFKTFYLESLNKNFYLAEIEVELSQPLTKQTVTLRGCALKSILTEKTRLVILSNLSYENNRLNELADIYLSRWPNLEETFQDYSRKIELFTYTANSRRFFSTETLFLAKDLTQDIQGQFDYYLKALDLYVKWHFLPYGYEDKDFPTIKERFYDLPAVFEPQKEHILLKFLPPSGYNFLSDLEYACRRINEREILFTDAKRLCCSIASL